MAASLVFFFSIAAILLPLFSTNDEVDALIAFRTSLSDHGNFLRNWDPDQVNPCVWFHVICNEDDQVTGLFMEDLNLSGHLVPELGKLQHLQYLELNKNSLQGTIPAELGDLKSLISLDLSHNNISGTIPPSLGKLKSLEFFLLNNNQLTGRIPRELANIPGLRIVDFSFNKLRGTIPPTQAIDIPSLVNSESCICSLNVCCIMSIFLVVRFLLL